MGLFDNIRKIRDKTESDSRPAILASTYSKVHRRFTSNADASSYIAKNMHKFYITSSKFTRGVQIKNLLRKLDISIPQEGFIYFLDEFRNLDFEGQKISTIVDYSFVLDYSIYDLNEIYFNPKEGPGFKNASSLYNKEMLAILDGMELLIYEINKSLSASSREDKSKYIHFFEDMIDQKAYHFEEALQRILFFNQLLYQTGHDLISLGRLDKILEDYYYDDINEGIISNEEAYGLIKDFLKALDSYSWYKTSDLSGSASQVITLGGRYVDDMGYYDFYNDLTYLFLKAVGEMELESVKLAIRLSYNSPDDMIDLALKAIHENTIYIEDGKRLKTEIDSNVIFSNDELVIPRLVEYGYSPEDAYGYVISSNLEPTVPSALDENSLSAISLIKPLNDIFENEPKELLADINDFDSLYQLYKDNLKREIQESIGYIESIEFNQDPLISLTLKESYLSQMDISEGGSKSNNFGIRFYGISNAIDSIYNLKTIVFEDRILGLADLNKMRKNNFKRKKYWETYTLIKNNPKRFGVNDNDILSLSNDLIKFIEDTISEKAHIKFGLSAPKYMVENDKCASFDACLKEEDPLNVLLSNNNGSMSIFEFASKLNYSKLGINGNLIELNLKSEDDLKKILVEAIGIGFDQLQINLIREEVIVKEPEEE